MKEATSTYRIVISDGSQWHEVSLGRVSHTGKISLKSARILDEKMVQVLLEQDVEILTAFEGGQRFTRSNAAAGTILQVASTIYKNKFQIP